MTQYFYYLREQERLGSFLIYTIVKSGMGRKRMIRQLIETAHENDAKVGICGQAPSDYPEFAEFLVKNGIDSMSLNPDSVIQVIKHLAQIEED